MRKPMSLIVPTIVASALLAGCGGGSSTKSTSSTAASPAAAGNEGGASAIVKTATSPSLGKTVLVDTQGMTLYALSGERSGRFSCTSSACEGAWHPLTVSAGATPTGSVGSLGVAKRPDGAMQITYKGMPLYTFAEDHAPGEARGQGIKDVGTWSAIPASGEAPAHTGSPSSASGAGGSSSGAGGSSSGGGSSSSEGGGGGYGY